MIMNALRSALVALALLLLFTPSLRADDVQGRLQTAVDAKNGILEVTVQLQAEAAFNLGATTLHLGFDNAALDFAETPEAGAKRDYLYHAYDTQFNKAYTSTVTRAKADLVSLNIFIFAPGEGTAVSAKAFQDVATLRFKIKDANADPALAFAMCQVSADDFEIAAATCDGFSGKEGMNLRDAPEATDTKTAAEPAFSIGEAYPNPFNPQSQFTLQVPEAEHVRIDLFDVTGRLVETLYNDVLPAGTQHRFTIDGSGLSSGVYLYRMAGETFTESRRVTLLK